MSPSNFYSPDVRISFVSSSTSGGVGTSVYGVRPVLSLKPDIEFSGGDGTMNNPFVILYN